MIGPSRIGDAAEVVGLLDAKTHLRVDHDDEDELISMMTASATEMVSNHTGLILGSEGWQFSVGPQAGRLRIPVAPVRSLTSVQYLDRDRAAQNASLDDFLLIADYSRPYLMPIDGTSWPITARDDDAITVTVAAGLLELPPPLKVAILMMLSHLYEDRGDNAMDEIPTTVRVLVEPYRRNWVEA